MFALFLLSLLLLQYLAVLQEGSNAVPIFKMSTRKLTNVDTNFEDLTFLKWSKTGYELAVGTSKGNLLIYKASAKKKIPIMGKHTRVCVDQFASKHEYYIRTKVTSNTMQRGGWVHTLEETDTSITSSFYF